MQECVVKNNTHFSINRSVSDFLKIISALLVMFSHYFNLKAQAGFELNAFEWCIRSQGGKCRCGSFLFPLGLRTYVKRDEKPSVGYAIF